MPISKNTRPCEVRETLYDIVISLLAVCDYEFDKRQSREKIETETPVRIHNLLWKYIHSQ